MENKKIVDIKDYKKKKEIEAKEKKDQEAIDIFVKYSRSLGW